MKRVGQIFREKLLEDIQDGVKSNAATFVLSYSTLSGAKMDQLRKSMKGVDARISVNPNRVSKIALRNLDYPQLAELIANQTAFVWSDADSVTLSKALVDFAKDNEEIKIQGGVLDGRVLAQNDIKRLSELPSKEVLQAQLLMTILAPLTRLAGAMNAKSRDLLSILKQLSEKKEGGK